MTRTLAPCTRSKEVLVRSTGNSTGTLSPFVIGSSQRRPRCDYTWHKDKPLVQWSRLAPKQRRDSQYRQIGETRHCPETCASIIASSLNRLKGLTWTDPTSHFRDMGSSPMVPVGIIRKGRVNRKGIPPQVSVCCWSALNHTAGRPDSPFRQV